MESVEAKNMMSKKKQKGTAVYFGSVIFYDNKNTQKNESLKAGLAITA
jgi:hypothetical protein